MCKAVYGARTEAFLTFLFDRRTVTPHSYINFNISRDRIVEDTIKEIVKYTGNDLKKPLKVTFKNELGVDAGWLHSFIFSTFQNFNNAYPTFIHRWC